MRISGLIRLVSTGDDCHSHLSLIKGGSEKIIVIVLRLEA